MGSDGDSGVIAILLVRRLWESILFLEKRQNWKENDGFEFRVRTFGVCVFNMSIVSWHHFFVYHQFSTRDC